MVRIDCSNITDWETFRDEFAQSFGFPAFYGRNLNAWIDCKPCLDEDDECDVTISTGEHVTLQLFKAAELKRTKLEILSTILELSAFINWRRVEQGHAPILMVSCYA